MRLATVIATVAVALGIILGLLMWLALEAHGQLPPSPVAIGTPLPDQCRRDLLAVREQNIQLQRIIVGQLSRLTEFEQQQLDAEKAALAKPPNPPKLPPTLEEKE